MTHAVSIAVAAVASGTEAAGITLGAKSACCLTYSSRVTSLFVGVSNKRHSQTEKEAGADISYAIDRNGACTVTCKDLEAAARSSDVKKRLGYDSKKKGKTL